jgi:hypothetical protein
MLNLNKLIIDLILADTAIKNSLGYTATDKRVYGFYAPKDVIYNDSKPSCIFFKTQFGKRKAKYSYPAQYPDVFIYFRVLSITQLNREQVADRLLKIFDQKYNLKNTEFNVKFSEISNYTDGIIEGTPVKPIYTKNISVKLNDVFRF